MKILQSDFLSTFVCTGDQCPDTCCKGWGMQVDDATWKRYEAKAPELTAAVAQSESGRIMARDPQTDHCVKFNAGWCGIQKQYGSDFLSDACHFYPRVTRGMGGRAVMTAALSCPEIARLALLSDAGFDYVEGEAARLPSALKEYKPEGLNAEEALSVHHVFLKAALDEATAPERIFSRLNSVSRSLQTLPVASWAKAAPFYVQNADARLPAAEEKTEDPFHLLHALAGLVSAAHKSDRARLTQTMRDMQDALGVAINPETSGITLSKDSVERYRALADTYNKEWKETLAPVLKRYIAAQLSLSFFPFAGLGNSLTDRVTIIGVRLATVKLALMCAIRKHEGGEDVIIRVVQSLSRFMDHLSDPALSVQIYEETGWVREARMRGLLRDHELQ